MLHRHGKEQSNPHAILLESLIKEWYVTSGNVKRFPRLIPRRVERDLHRWRLRYIEPFGMFFGFVTPPTRLKTSF